LEGLARVGGVKLLLILVAKQGLLELRFKP